jgi:hypothetical protein
LASPITAFGFTSMKERFGRKLRLFQHEVSKAVVPGTSFINLDIILVTTMIANIALPVVSQ